MTLDKCPQCQRAGSAYCAEMGRPCGVSRPDRAPRVEQAASGRYDRKWRDAFDHGNREKLRRYWLRKSQEPARERYRAGQPKPTHCLHGHELTPDNVRVERNTNGRSQRRCLECVRRRQRKPSYTLTSTSPEAST
jgi:hypothetical protein